MRRRRFLASLSVLSLGPLTGCLSASEPESDSPTPPALPESGDGLLSEFDVGDPFDSERIGTPSGDTLHRAIIWNDDADRRTIGLRLSRPEADGSVLDIDPTFPAYGVFRIELFRPDDYVFAVTPPTTGPRRLGIREGFIDCNESATHVAVRPDGTVRARVVSTAMGCDVASATATGGETDPSPGQTTVR